ncbi:DUF4231 domain-containing protein, partial [Enterococcus faecium]|nr:DUF4231 domain-containing protein [Enterococcus faecium]
MIGEKMMDQKAFIESIDSTIDRLKKEIRFYNRVIGIGNIIKIVLSASIPILIDQASEHRSLLLIVSIASAIITIIQSGMSAFNYQDKAQTSTELLMKIEKEKLLYITKTSPYNKTDEENFHLIVTTLQTELNDIISDFNQV